jgi:hypothetical protein
MSRLLKILFRLDALRDHLCASPVFNLNVAFVNSLYRPRVFLIYGHSMITLGPFKGRRESVATHNIFFDRRTQIILYLRHSFIITFDRYRPGVK